MAFFLLASSCWRIHEHFSNNSVNYSLADSHVEIRTAGEKNCYLIAVWSPFCRETKTIFPTEADGITATQSQVPNMCLRWRLWIRQRDHQRLHFERQFGEWVEEWLLQPDCPGFKLTWPLPSWLTLGKSLAFLVLSLLICEMVWCPLAQLLWGLNDWYR